MRSAKVSPAPTTTTTPLDDFELGVSEVRGWPPSNARAAALRVAHLASNGLSHPVASSLFRCSAEALEALGRTLPYRELPPTKDRLSPDDRRRVDEFGKRRWKLPTSRVGVEADLDEDSPALASKLLYRDASHERWLRNEQNDPDYRPRRNGAAAYLPHRHYESSPKQAKHEGWRPCPSHCGIEGRTISANEIPAGLFCTRSWDPSQGGFHIVPRGDTYVRKTDPEIQLERDESLRSKARSGMPTRAIASEHNAIVGEQRELSRRRAREITQPLRDEERKAQRALVGMEWYTKRRPSAQRAEWIERQAQSFAALRDDPDMIALRAEIGSHWTIDRYDAAIRLGEKALRPRRSKGV